MPRLVLVQGVRLFLRFLSELSLETTLTTALVSITSLAHGADAWEAARPAKIKKVVDTRASKGRKLRSVLVPPSSHLFKRELTHPLLHPLLDLTRRRTKTQV